MKLLLQRSLSHHLEGPFWIESAHLDDTRLHAFLDVARDRNSHFEPRYAPNGEVYWISDKETVPKVFRQNSKEPLTQRPTFKFSFQGKLLVTLESRDEDSPYQLVVDGRMAELSGALSELDDKMQELKAVGQSSQLSTAVDLLRRKAQELKAHTSFMSSLTHLDAIPGSGDWLISSLDTLYRGPLGDLKDQGPTPARRFSVGPTHFYYTQRHELLQQALEGGTPERIFACQEGGLVYPLYTPKGILVTQEDCADHHLWLVDPQRKEASSLWNGPDEWVYACAATGRT